MMLDVDQIRDVFTGHLTREKIESKYSDMSSAEIRKLLNEYLDQPWLRDYQMYQPREMTAAPLEFIKKNKLTKRQIQGNLFSADAYMRDIPDTIELGERNNKAQKQNHHEPMESIISYDGLDVNGSDSGSLHRAIESTINDIFTKHSMQMHIREVFIEHLSAVKKINGWIHGTWFDGSDDGARNVNSLRRLRLQFPCFLDVRQDKLKRGGMGGNRWASFVVLSLLSGVCALSSMCPRG
jgi:hypothetical protein